MLSRSVTIRLGILIAMVSLIYFLPLTGVMALCAVLAYKINLGLSYVQRLIVVGAALIVTNGLLYEIFVITNLKPSMLFVGAFYLLAAVASVFKLPNHPPKSILTATDVAVCMMILVSFITLMLPLFKHPVGSTLFTRAIHQLSGGEDHASHFAMYHYFIQNNEYSYGEHSKESGLIEGLNNYPQLSDFTLAWGAKSLPSPATSSTGRIVIMYYLLTALNFSVLIGFVVLLALKTLEHQREKMQIGYLPLLLAAAFTLLIAGPLLELNGRGFVSQIFALTYLVFALLLVTIGPRIKNDSLFALLLILAFSGVAMSWWYLLPVTTSLLFVKGVFKRVLPRSTSSWFLMIVIGLGSVYPIIMGLLNSGPSNTNPINLPGGVDKISTVALALYVGLSLIALYVLKKKGHLGPYGIVISSALVFTIFIAIFQLSTVHELRYYFYKALYTFIPLLTALILAGLISLVSKIKRVQLRVISLVGIPIILILGLVILKPVYLRVYANDWFNNPTTHQDYKDILTSKNSGKKDYIMISACTPSHAYTINRWSGALLLSDKPKRADLMQRTFSGFRKKDLAYVDSLPTDVTVVKDLGCPTK